MSASFGMCCGRCGYGELYPAPEVKDIAAAATAMGDAGWGFDARGRARCPECMKNPEAEPAPGRPVEPDLFS